MKFETKFPFWSFNWWSSAWEWTEKVKMHFICLKISGHITLCISRSFLYFSACLNVQEYGGKICLRVSMIPLKWLSTEINIISGGLLICLIIFCLCQQGRPLSAAPSPPNIQVPEKRSKDSDTPLLEKKSTRPRSEVKLSPRTPCLSQLIYPLISEVSCNRTNDLLDGSEWPF